ncbi:Teneurin-2 [Frankliniella fusca]|uniref:Teneurin-2 n=1 Tax=Frankliniella fusca TaxID=407009 RepID=A0AAE1HLF7_9NEOP|nr:Teneurin-2 [Frankliniella fusca]
MTQWFNFTLPSGVWGREKKCRPNCVHIFRFQLAASLTTTSMKNPASSILPCPSKFPIQLPADCLCNMCPLLCTIKTSWRKPCFASTWGQGCDFM